MVGYPLMIRLYRGDRKGTVYLGVEQNWIFHPTQLINYFTQF
jgi:hypothetical protein